MMSNKFYRSYPASSVPSFIYPSGGSPGSLSRSLLIMLITPHLPKMLRYPLLIVLFAVFSVACNTTSTDSEPPFTGCSGGLSEGYPCSNTGLYARLGLSELMSDPSSGKLNDIWGWADPETGKEYALVGLTDGVTFVDVTDPSEPVVTGKLEEPAPQQKTSKRRHDDGSGFKDASDWRDLKVYQNTLYVVSEQQGHGIQVFDLTRLRDVQNTPATFQNDARYTLFDNAHNIAVNEETGFAYVVGITSGDVCAERGGLHMVDINQPLQPEYAGCYFDEASGGHTRNGYIHDTQCVVYDGPDDRYRDREICFSSAEHAFLITDVNSKENAGTIAVTGYEGSGYSHQGWLSEDHRYFFMNDELDERTYHHNTRTYVWDMEDLENPEFMGYYQHDTFSVDHNLYIYNDIMYQANYTAGLRILDVSNPNPESITELGFFDTTPQNGSSDLNFAGLWSVYPWLSGNKILVSDINNGLFILRFDRGGH